MANNPVISTAARNAMCNALVDLIDAGSSNGYIQIRTGSQPANPGTAASGTLLATLNMSDPAFGNASTGVATAEAITNDSSADATGTAGYFRIYDSDNTAILDGTVGTSGADINFNTVSFVSGDAVSITSLTVTVPSGE